MRLRSLHIMLPLLFLGLAAQAQQTDPANDAAGARPAPRTPETRAQLQTDRLATRLSLTPAQRDSVFAINLRTAQRMETVRAERRAANRAAVQAHQAREAQIEQVLDETQRSQYQELKAERREHVRARGSTHGRMRHRRGRHE